MGVWIQTRYTHPILLILDDIKIIIKKAGYKISRLIYARFKKCFLRIVYLHIHVYSIYSTKRVTEDTH